LGQTQLIVAQTDVRLQRATLGKLVGQPGETLRLAAPAPPAGATIQPPATGDRIEQHPAALQATARVRQQQAQLRGIEGAYAPRVDVLASAFARGEGRSATGAFGDGSAGLGPTTGNWAVGLQVTVPIGSYPALHAEQQAQKAAIEAERDRYDQTLRDLEERLQQARASLDSTEAIARITPTGLVAARKAEEQQRARFRSGLATVVDVTVAEATLAQAESQDAIAQLNVWRALGVYAAASGDLAQLRTALAGK
jgi:outer membrane protein TolC